MSPGLGSISLSTILVVTIFLIPGSICYISLSRWAFGSGRENLGKTGVITFSVILSIGIVFLFDRTFVRKQVVNVMESRAFTSVASARLKIFLKETEILKEVSMLLATNGTKKQEVEKSNTEVANQLPDKNETKEGKGVISANKIDVLSEAVSTDFSSDRVYYLLTTSALLIIPFSFFVSIAVSFLMFVINRLTHTKDIFDFIYFLNCNIVYVFEKSGLRNLFFLISKVVMEQKENLLTFFDVVDKKIGDWIIQDNSFKNNCFSKVWKFVKISLTFLWNFFFESARSLVILIFLVIVLIIFIILLIVLPALKAVAYVLFQFVSLFHHPHFTTFFKFNRRFDIPVVEVKLDDNTLCKGVFVKFEPMNRNEISSISIKNVIQYKVTEDGKNFDRENRVVYPFGNTEAILTIPSQSIVDFNVWHLKLSTFGWPNFIDNDNQFKNLVW